MDAAGRSATDPVAGTVVQITAATAAEVNGMIGDDHNISRGDSGGGGNGAIGGGGGVRCGSGSGRIGHLHMGQMMRGSYNLTVCDVVESKKGHISLSAAHSAFLMQMRMPPELPEPLEPVVEGRDRDSPSEMSSSSSSSESDEDEVVASCRDFYRRRLSSKWIVRQDEEDLTESESSDHPGDAFERSGSVVVAVSGSANSKKKNKISCLRNNNNSSSSSNSNNNCSSSSINSNHVKGSLIPKEADSVIMVAADPGDLYDDHSNSNNNRNNRGIEATTRIFGSVGADRAEGIGLDTSGESDHDSGIEVLNRAPRNSSIEEMGRASPCSNNDNDINNNNNNSKNNANMNDDVNSMDVLSCTSEDAQQQQQQMDTYTSSTSAIGCDTPGCALTQDDINSNDDANHKDTTISGGHPETIGCATSVPLLSVDVKSNQSEDNSVISCPFEQLQIRRSGLLDAMEETTTKFASKLNLLKAQIGSLMEKDNQLFRQLLDLHDSITDLRKSQIISPPTPSDIVIPAHYSFFGPLSRSSSFSSSENSDTTVSPASSPAGSPLTVTPSATPSSTPLSTPVSPSAMSTTSSSRSSYSVKQRSTCCRRCSAYSQRQNKCRQLSGSSLSRKKRSLSISNISSGSDSGFELKLHSESDHEIFV